MEVRDYSSAVPVFRLSDDFSGSLSGSLLFSIANSNSIKEKNGTNEKNNLTKIKGAEKMQ